MARTIMGAAAVSLDGFIADVDDRIGPLFDWLGNGDVEWTWTEGHEDSVRTTAASGDFIRACTRRSARW